MLLYHVNFGWPLIDEGTKLLWQGNTQAKPGGINADLFNDKTDFKTCPAPLDSHSGTGEAVAFIDPVADDAGLCEAGVHNEKLGLSVRMSWQKKQLPWLINWQHWGRGEYVTGIEPATHPPIGQAAARANSTLLFLQPGERRIFDLELTVKNSVATEMH